MNFGSIDSLLGDHVLYKLQNKDSGEAQGFAFVKRNQDTSDNLQEMILVPISGNIFQVIGVNDEPLATSDQSKSGQNCENEESFPTPESNYQQESKKIEIESLETDLNLSEVSSTNETTLDECHSQSSYTSPILLPRKLSQSLSEHDVALNVKSPASLLSVHSVKSSSTDDIKSTSQLLSSDQAVKTENSQTEDGSEDIKVDV